MEIAPGSRNWCSEPCRRQRPTPRRRRPRERGTKGHEMRKHPVIGVHVSKTKIEAAVLKRRDVPLGVKEPAAHREFEPLVAREEKIGPSTNYGELLKIAAALIERVAKDNGLEMADTPVGVAMPGAVSRSRGRGGLIKNSSLDTINGTPFAFEL